VVAVLGEVLLLPTIVLSLLLLFRQLVLLPQCRIALEPQLD
jgi:hypothetical protein